MLRNVLAVLAALVTANVLIFTGEAINGLIYPFPEGFDFNDAAAVKAMVAAMPLGAYAGIELSYVAGAAGAGAVIGKLASSRHLWLAGGVGAASTLANFANMAMIPHPAWFAVLTTVTFIPVAVLVARAVAPRP